MFTIDDVQRLAALARLELTDEEASAFARQLGEILDFARQVQAVDTSVLEPSADGVERIAGTVLVPEPPPRDDSVQPSLPRETVLSAAPDADARAGLFKVPRVLNG